MNPRARALLRAVARPELAGLLVCCGLAVVVFARAWDGALFLWFLRWTPHALLEGLNPLLGTHLNVPGGVNLMWNTSLPLPGALMTPVTVHLGLPVTVTALYTLALALSAWFASIAFRRYVRSYPAALLVALVLLFPRQVPGRAGRALLGIGAAAVVFAVLAGWPLAYQFLGPHRVAGAIQETSRNGSDLYSFVVPTRIMAVTPAAALQLSGRFVGRVGELNGYLGIPLVGLLVFTVVRWWRSGVVRVAFVTGLVMLVLSMGERLHVGGRILDVPLPWAAMKSLPLVESAIPTRFMLIADLFCGLLLAIFVGPDANGRPKFGPVGTRLSGWMTKIRLGWRKPTLGPGLRRELVADLVRWRVETVVVGPMDPPATEATMVRFLTDLLGRPPERVAGVWVWWQVQPWSLERWRDGQTPMVRAAV